MKFFKNIRNIFSNMMVLSLMLIVTILTIQIFSRYLLKFSFSWVPELSQVLFIVMVLLGSYTLLYDNDHIYINFLEKYLNERLKQFLILFRNIVMFLVVIVIIYGSYYRGINTLKHTFITMPFLKVAYIYFIMFISLLLQGFWIIINIINSFRNINKLLKKER